MFATWQTLSSDLVFEEIKRRASNPAIAKKVNAVIGYQITKGGKVAKTWSEYLATKFNMTVVAGALE